MERQIQVNWNNFEKRFNGKEQSAFEEFAYCLFCYEHDIKKGLFRYKNQTGIETDPVEIGGEIIGFQAKYYERSTELSGKKSKLIDSIKDAKRKNPQITKLFFYLNKEFGESTRKEKKDPDYKTEIELAGIEEGVEVVWRVKSHFEIQINQMGKSFIAEYYFGADNSVWDFVSNMEKHTEYLLNNIKEKICYNNIEVFFHKQDYEDKFLTAVHSDKQCMIISGVGGSGKTAFVKKWYYEQNLVLFVWKMSEFSIASIQELFNNYGSYTVYDFVQIFDSETRKKYIVLDSAETLYEMLDIQPLLEFLSLMKEHGWTFVFTIRTTFVENLRRTLKENGFKEIELIDIDLISELELNKTAKDFNILLPDNRRVYELLRIPFYLNEYLHAYSADLRTAVTISHFMERLWRKKVLGESIIANRIHIRRKNLLYGIIKYKAEHNCFFIRENELPDYDQEALQCLMKDEVMDEDARQRCYIAHDIYEEWAWFNYIEEDYIDYQYNVESFFEHLLDTMSCRRSLRQWLIFNLEDERQELLEFVLRCIELQDIDAKWKDDLYIAILESKYSYQFFEKERTLMVKNNCEFLYRMVFLLRTTRKKANSDLQLMIPEGYGWSAVIRFINENYVDVFSTDVDRKQILELLKDWSSFFNKGEVAKIVAKIACKMFDSEKYLGKIESDLISIILNVSVEIKSHLMKMLQHEKENRKDGRYSKIFYSLLNSFEGIDFKVQCVDDVAEIAEYYWLKIEEKYVISDDWEDMFGINGSYSCAYHPISAYQTPIYWMLHGEEEKTFDFIIKLINLTIENYVNYTQKRNEYDLEQIVVVVDGKSVKQYVNDRIWQMYRGTQTGPNLLICVLAALEKYLLEKGEEWDEEELLLKIKYLVAHSKCAAITAVAISLIAAYPYKLYKLALDFLTIPEIIRYDRVRLYYEKELKTIIGINANLRTAIAQICVNERKETLDDKFRNRLFENIILEYQLVKNANFDDSLSEKIWDIMDKKFEEYSDLKEGDEIASLYKMYYTYMDIRKNEFEEYVKDGISGIILKPQLDNQQKEKQEILRIHSEFRKEKERLYLWVHERFEENKKEYAKYTEYEENPQKVFEEMENFPEFIEDYPEYDLLIKSLPPYICAVLIRDFSNKLEEEQLETCILFTINFAKGMLKYPDQKNMNGVGNEAIISSLVFLLDDKENSEMACALLIFLLFVMNSDFKEMIAKELQNNCSGYNQYFAFILVKYHDKYLNFVKCYYNGNDRKKLFMQFWKENVKGLSSLLEKENALSEEHFQDNSISTIRLVMEITINNEHSIFCLAFQKFIQIYMSSNKDRDAKDIDTIWKIFEMFARVLFMCEDNMAKELTLALIPALRKDQWLHRVLMFIIMEADKENNKTRFWAIWNMFYDFIVSVAQTEEQNQVSNSKLYYTGSQELQDAIMEYLFAGSQTWSDSARKWHMLSEDCVGFLDNCYNALGFHKATLYSVSYFITHIGNELFFDNGISWIYNIIVNNKHLINSTLIVNTLYYLEKIMHKYSKQHMEAIKKKPFIRKKVSKILDFMVEHGSTYAFMLREEI